MTPQSVTGTAAVPRRGLISLALAKATIVIGGFSVVNLVVGLIRGKFAAEMLGPAGVGLVSQANTFFLGAALVCGLGVSAGVVKRVAAESSEGRSEPGLDAVSTALTTQMLVTTIFVTAALIAFRPLYGALFPRPGLELVFALVLVGLPFSIAASGVMDPLFFGANRYDLYTKASIAGVVLGLLPFLFLIWTWGVLGAIVAIPVAAVLRFCAFAFYGTRLHPLRRLFRFRVDVGALRELLRYGTATFVVSAIGSAVAIFIRTQIIHRLGEQSNGLYQVPVTFAGYYAPFLTNGLWGHLYPYVSAYPRREASEEAHRAARMMILAVTAVTLPLLLVHEWAIALVFSGQFVGASEFLPVQLLGDLFYFPAFTLAVFCLGLGGLRAYVASSVAFSALQIACTLVLLPQFGLRGVAAAYAVSAFGFLIVSVALSWRIAAPVAGAPGTVGLFVMSAVALGAEVVIVLVGAPTWMRIVPLVAWGGMVLARSETWELLRWGFRHGVRVRERLRQRFG